jgi:YHS domain-containing protein/thiol-disulfide isomerase/thioredoxin
MFPRSVAVGSAVLLFAVCVPAPAQQPPPQPKPQERNRLNWETNLETAQRKAAETNRLVLIHLGGPWCKYCVKLEREVFNQAGFGRELSSDFVAVKLDLPQHNAIATKYGVELVPSDIITTPDGELVSKFNSPLTAPAYLAAMRQVVVDARAKGLLVDAETRVAQSQTPDRGGRYAQAPRGGTRPKGTIPTKNSPDPKRYDVRRENTPPPEAEPVDDAHADELPRLPPGSPPLGLDGFCPVTLCEKRDCWVAGDIRWGAIHRGHTYLFAGEAEQKAFLADPDRYAPVLDGNDPVLALERSRAVPGARDHGVFYEGRVYLFASEDTLEVFRKDPDRYAIDLRQARRNQR